jgi:hypothetical protein
MTPKDIETARAAYRRSLRVQIRERIARMTDFSLAVGREPWLAIRRDLAILCSVRAVGFVARLVPKARRHASLLWCLASDVR